MRKLLLAAVFAGSVAFVAPPANACHMIRPWDPGCLLHNQNASSSGSGSSAATADGATFQGGCDEFTVNDGTPGDTLGGDDVWNGIVRAWVVARDGGSVAVTCSIKVNGTDQGAALAASGVGVAANAGRLTFTAAIEDSVALCTNVTTSSGTESVCVNTTTIPVCPIQVCGEGGLYEQVFAALDGIADPLTCSVLMGLAPSVDSLPTAGVLYIDPSSGDVDLMGGRFKDCPPYEAPQ